MYYKVLLSSNPPGRGAAAQTRIRDQGGPRMSASRGARRRRVTAYHRTVPGTG